MLKTLKRWLTRKPSAIVVPAGRLHDYTKCGWAHSVGDIYHNMDTNRYSMVGHGHGISRNDKLILTADDGRVIMFKVLDIGYFRDPSDMWSLTAKFEGYMS